MRLLLGIVCQLVGEVLLATCCFLVGPHFIFIFTLQCQFYVILSMDVSGLRVHFSFVFYCVIDVDATKPTSWRLLINDLSIYLSIYLSKLKIIVLKLLIGLPISVGDIAGKCSRS